MHLNSLNTNNLSSGQKNLNQQQNKGEKPKQEQKETSTKKKRRQARSKFIYRNKEEIQINILNILELRYTSEKNSKTENK